MNQFCYFHDLTENPNCFNHNSPVQVPLFPKLPFGMHSEKVNIIRNLEY